MGKAISITNKTPELLGLFVEAAHEQAQEPHEYVIVFDDHGEKWFYQKTVHQHEAKKHVFVVEFKGRQKPKRYKSKAGAKIALTHLLKENLALARENPYICIFSESE